MDATKLESWIRRDRKHAARLRVVATELGNGGVEVASWQKAELIEASSPAAAVFDACQDYCDSKGESVNFRLEWLRADGTSLTNIWHRHAPLEGETPISNDAVNADISMNRLCAALLRKDEAKDRLIVGAIASIFSPLEHTIRLQQQIIDQQSKQLLQLHQQVQAARDTSSEATEEEKTEALARANAWNKLAEVGPLVLQAGIEQFIERRTGGGEPNGSGHA